MSTSLPSRQIFAVDVPEVKNFKVVFKYNFFTPDEQVNERSGIPRKLISRSTGETDDKTVKYFESRVPRYVLFSWNKSKFADPGNLVLEKDIIAHAHKTHPVSTLIATHYDKIVMEDHFSDFNYVAVTFHDGDIDTKIYNLISGSSVQRNLVSSMDPHAVAVDLNNQTPENVDMSVLDHGSAGKSASGRPLYPRDKKTAAVPGSASGQEHHEQFHDSHFDAMKGVVVTSQINSKFFHDVTSRMIQDPHASDPTELLTLNQHAHKLSLSTKRRLNSAINENEFKTVAPHIHHRVDRTSHHQQRHAAELVGYVIDKYAVNPNGTTTPLHPIIIENPAAHQAIDSFIKYDQNYFYTIRAIARFYLPAIDKDSGDVATIQLLVSSQPFAKQHVRVHDMIAPPSPTDINFNWDYENNKLVVHWTFPPNPQRDIKRFQVFRRASINHPFELIKEYNFDDSAIKMDDGEHPDPKLIMNSLNPASFYVDDDFVKDSKYIYTVCCIDAHGLTSCYGAQYELSFDRFKNQLVKRLVSHSGAPKPYPNLYLPGEGFVDVARVSGPSSKKFRVFFTPQYYLLEDNKKLTHSILSTNQSGGYYKLQFINTDNQKSDSLTIKIDDKIKVAEPKLAYPVANLKLNKKSLSGI